MTKTRLMPHTLVFAGNPPDHHLLGSRFACSMVQGFHDFQEQVFCRFQQFTLAGLIAFLRLIFAYRASFHMIPQLFGIFSTQVKS